MTAEVHSARHTRTLEAVPLDAIAPSSLNPRKLFRDEDLAELADSIRQDGLLEPVVVRRAPGGNPDSYELIAGERRWRAARLAGLEAIPARLLGDVDDATALRLALVENLQRVDLDPIEEAEGYAALNRVCGLRQAEIAAAVKRQQPFVAKRMALLDLPEDVRERIRAGEISVSHGVALARFRDFPKVASWYAEEAAKGRYKSKDLESDLPHHWELDRLGVLRSLDSGNVTFDTTVCREACPYGAYAKREYGAGACLKPEHAKQLQAEHEESQREALQRQIETAQAHGGALPSTSDLKFGTYEDLSYRQQRPSECNGMCPCRGVAIGHGGKPIAICTDPKRYRQLEAADRKLQQQATRKALNARIAEIQAAMDRLEAVGERELAIVGAQIVSRFLADTTKLALRHAGGSIDHKGLSAYGGGALRGLAELAPMDLVRFLVEAVLIDELHRSIQYGSRLNSATSDWYLKTRPWEADYEPDAPTAADSPLVQPGPNPCADCGRQMEPEGATTCNHCDAAELEEAAPPCPNCGEPVGSSAGMCDTCTTAAMGLPYCRRCGCTDQAGCEGGCYWIEDDLCSACAVEGAYEQEQQPAAEVAHA